MPQLHPPARSTGCRPIFAAATPAAHRCRAWAHAPKTAVLRVLLHPAQTRSCAEMTAISRQAGGRTDRFVAQLVHRRAISPRRLSPAVRQATGGTERSWAADWVSVHAYRVYYGVGQRRPLWVGNAGVSTAFAALRTRCVPEAGTGSQGTLSNPSTRSACGPPREPFSTSSGARAGAACVCSHSFCGYGAPVFGASQFKGSFAPCGLDLGYVSEGDCPALRLLSVLPALPVRLSVPVRAYTCVCVRSTHTHMHACTRTHTHMHAYTHQCNSLF